jgi:putative membrane protein|tara:strand:+ start:1354 stop:1647 length:294 start_codon:yes stop_codon:yes gene_type:complete
MQRIITIAIFITVFAAGAAFSAVNNTPVNIQYYLGTVTMPISIIVIVSLVIGITIGVLAIFVGSLQLRYENKRLQKKIDLREQELDSLRILPIKDTH